MGRYGTGRDSRNEVELGVNRPQDLDIEVMPKVCPDADEECKDGDGRSLIDVVGAFCELSFQRTMRYSAYR